MKTQITLANGKTLNTKTMEIENMQVKQKSVKAPRGFVLFDGASILDGSPIVAVATMETANEKTGNMVQVWIIRSDMSPTQAVQTGKDSAVCGMCPHRHNLNGACYVKPFQAPRAVFEAYKKGLYPAFDYDNAVHVNALKNRQIRLGSYGDPAAVPFKIMSDFVKMGVGHTGYTHQVKHPNFDNNIATLCMISCDTEKQAQQMTKKGFKTFRVKTEKMQKLNNEIECLSDAKGLSCIECGLCSGSNAPVNIVINVHGTLKGRFDKFERII